MTDIGDGEVPDRRTTPRLAVEGQIDGAPIPVGELIGARTPTAEVIAVLDLGLGGLSLRLRHEVKVEDILPLQLWSLACSAFTVPAAVVHAMRVGGPEDTHYFAGLKFITTDEEVMRAIEELVKSIQP